MLHFVETGQGDPVVLLHAFPVDSALWAAQRHPIAQAGFRVITPDLPGFGGSRLAEAEPSVDVMADEVVGVLDHLGITRAVVGGLSMGGYVTMALLRRHPDRLRAIALVDTKGDADPPAAAANRHAVAAAVEAAGSTSDLAETMLPNLLGATTRAERPEVVAAVRRWITAQPPAAVAWAQRAMAARPGSLEDIAAFGRPVLVLHGAEDTISPAADARAMVEAARLGGSPTRLVEVPAAGHLTAVEAPEPVTQALLDWLGTL
ncbi:MAG: alpha/beta hydrolase [Candidatus Nanopelagicales bacterium]|jgi:pimeloyl-ACP methyl ester carboxylesterase|nr:alpha/beta hydrolase [Candidatus Nanopelagicales bacterium]